MDRSIRPLVIVASFAASLLVGLVIMLWALGGLRGVTAPAAIGGPFQLTDQAGQTVTDKDLKGRPTLIFFGFTHCPDVCPTALFEISEVLKAMGKDADRVNAFFVSVDPERDTAAAMKDYLSSFDPHLKGLTGNPEAVAKVLSAYRVYSKKVPLKDGDYTMDHTALIYLMDRDGRFVSPFNLKRTPAGSRDRSEEVSLSRAKAAKRPRIGCRMVYKAIQFHNKTPAMPHQPALLPSARLPKSVRGLLTGLSIAAALAVVLSGDGFRANRAPGPRSRPRRRRCPASGTRGGVRTGPTCRASP